MLPVGQFCETCATSCGGITPPAPPNIPPPLRRLRRIRRVHSACRHDRRPLSSATAADRHSLHRQLQRRAGAHGFNFIRAFLDILAGHRPAVFPQQRANIQHAGAAPVQVRFIVAGELLHAVAQVQQAEVAGPDHAAAGADEQLAAALDHVDAHVVQEGAGHLSGAAHADVVAGVGAPTATAVRGQQVIPAVVIDHVRGFAVDGDVHGLVDWNHPLAGLGIELHEADIAKIRAVGQPQLAVGGVQENGRIDRIAVLDAVR